MTPNDILVLLMFLSFIALLFTGFPIAFVLGGVSIIFTLVGYLSDLYLGTATGLGFNTVSMIINRIFKILDNWTMVSLPMFVYMGIMLDRSGLAEHMMKSMQDAFGKIHGGLAITVCVIGILLAASTGIVGASVVLMALLALPAMLRQGYDKSLAAGVVAASGTLGILIPPSIMLVMMADQLSVSVGDLFMGALFPGLILGFLYISYIVILGILRPHKMPLPANLKPVTLGTLWRAFKAALPTFGLIIAVLGSIFAGIATITEASGVGAMGATLVAYVNKRLSVKVFKEVAHLTFNTIGYIFAILIGATCFALVLRLLGGDDLVQRGLQAIPLGPQGIIALILFAVFLMGFFLDWIEITFIVLPLIGPAVAAMDLPISGYGVVENPKLTWFCVLTAVCLQTSFLTPPVGFSLFYLKGSCPPEVSMLDIFRGIIPFVVLQVIGVLFTFFWPALTLWLPAMTYK